MKKWKAFVIISQKSKENTSFFDDIKVKILYKREKNGTIKSEINFSVKGRSRQMRKKIAFILLCSFLSCLFALSTKAVQLSKRVLFLSSYSLDWPTVPLQIQGFKDTLNKEYLVDYFFLNTKNITYNDSYKALSFQQIQYLIQEKGHYDAVVAGDDDALNFVMGYQEELFPRTPILFHGINDYNQAQIYAQNDYVTGIIENLDYEENIRIATTLLPNTSRINIIYDQSITGMGEFNQFMQGLEDFNEKTNKPLILGKQINTSIYDIAGLTQQVQSLSKDEINFLLLFNETKSSKVNNQEANEIINKISSVPFFRSNDLEFGGCIIGGYVYQHSIATQRVGMMLNDIFSVENPVSVTKDLDVITDSFLRCKFDKKSLEKFGFDSNVLPENTIFINNAVSAWEMYSGIIIPVLLSIVIVFLILIVAVIYLSMNKKRSKILQEMNSKLEYSSTHDSLTGIPNKALFEKDIDKMIQEEVIFSLVMIDIDNFKNINDLYGHNEGDRLLVEVAEKLYLLRSDTVHIYRYGGDEFILLVETIDDRVLDDIYTQLKSSMFFYVEKKKLNITLCLGISKYPLHSKNKIQLISYADCAMYSCKQNGKNRYCVYENGLNFYSRTEVLIEETLKDAVAENKFVVYYQPIVDAKTFEIECYEALVRIADSTLSPNDFIPIAEKTGLVIPMTRLLIVQILALFEKIREQKLPLKKISLNFSTIQLSDKDFLRYIEEQFSKSGISPDNLVFEITESSAIKKPTEIQNFFSSFSKPVQLSLDDFGTGFSTLKNLVNYPFSYVKLEGSIVTQAIANHPDFLERLVELLHSIGSKVIAEGVETIQQAKALSHAKCDYLQGYLFSKPETAEDLLGHYNMKYDLNFKGENE